MSDVNISQPQDRQDPFEEELCAWLRNDHLHLILLPTEGQGLVVMTNSDNGSILAEALIRRVAQLYRWPPIGVLPG